MQGATATRESLEWIARVGLATRGVLYCLVAALALRIGFGDFSEEADRQGALQVVARQPMGRVLLVAITIGLLAHVLWRVVLAIRGEELTKRAADAGRALIYLFGAYAAVRLATGSGSAGGQEEQDWTARVLDWSVGPWVVGGVGVVIVAAGVWNGYRGLSGRWRDRLDTPEMEGLTERWATFIAAGGLLGRAVVFGLVGGFLVRAAVRHDPQSGVGLDGALKEVASKAYGPYALALLAAGLLLFGLFSFVEARYRSTLADS